MSAARIVFLSSAHSPFDDRIFYHQAISLINKNIDAFIIVSNEDIHTTKNNIKIIGRNKDNETKKQKIQFLYNELTQAKPQIIICSEPLPIIAANNYKHKIDKEVKILYDITEWYPSKKQLSNLTIASKTNSFLKLLIFNLYAASRCNGFIFGEYYKKYPYKILFPLKKHITLSYYPNLKYIQNSKSNIINNNICLGFTGKISIEKGIENFLKVGQLLKKKNPELNVKAKIIGWFSTENESILFSKLIKDIKNIEIEILEKVPFEEFSLALQDVNIFFDLRKIDFENTHCLPIKLFYYAACGRPVIYSNLKAIRQEIDVSEFGFLVDPTNTEQITNCILNYINDVELYNKHCLRAREIAENKYNWKNIEPLFLNFVNSFLSNNKTNNLIE